MAKEIDLGHIRFNSQKEAEEYFRAILNKYEKWQEIIDMDQVDLRALLERHPEAKNKIGCGIKRLYIGEDPEFHGKCFNLERIDGSSTDFSYKTCIKGKAKTLDQDFSQACRDAIWQQLFEAKKAYFEKYHDENGMVKCEVSGKLYKFEEVHADHMAPLTFEVLVNNFKAALNIMPSYDILTKPADNQSQAKFIDDRIKILFQDYHSKAAKLRFVGAKENSSLSAKHRIREPKRPIKLG